MWDDGEGDIENGDDHDITKIEDPELLPQDNPSDASVK